MNTASAILCERPTREVNRMSPANTIIYEQPMHEITRACLRLESLFKRIDENMSDITTQKTEYALAILINILEVLDPPDLKAKLTKELGRYITVLTRLEQNPEADQQKLRSTLDTLERLMHFSISTTGRFAQALREDEFLSNIRLNAAMPGGHSVIDMPAYRYWLYQDAIDRQTILKSWFAQLIPFREAATLLLKLVRESVKAERCRAEKGFYQIALDTQLALRMIRIGVPKTTLLYPEMSVSRHLLNIWFQEFDPTKIKKSNEDVYFQLSCCYS